MDKKLENISALMDGEISDAESGAIITDLSSNRELLLTWMRYHIIREAMKGRLPDNIIHNQSEPA